MEVIHVWNPARASDPGQKVHAIMYDSAPVTLCGSARTNKVHNGRSYRLYWPTDDPVSCTQCTASLEGIARNELHKLDAAALEELLGVIVKLRANGSERE